MSSLPQPIGQPWSSNINSISNLLFVNIPRELASKNKDRERFCESKREDVWKVVRLKCLYHARQLSERSSVRIYSRIVRAQLMIICKATLFRTRIVQTIYLIV
jgi:hypothetical protein